MAPINVTTSSEKVTAAVSEDKVTATVSGASPVSATVTAGFGATGPQGPSGVVNVTAPITNAGTTAAANIGISLGEGLSVSSGSLRVTPGTYATLVDGTVPSNLLPSYVDDVLEFANVASLPNTGETGKIYVAINTGKIYRWSGSAYFEISTPPDNTDAVPEGATNLYFTNARARNSFGTGATGQVVAWSGSEWTAGTVVIASVTGLQTALDGKAASSHNHDASAINAGTLAADRLPLAAANTRGAVRIGSGISITDGVISVSTAYAATSHTHALSSLTQSSATTGQVVTWSGSAWAAANIDGGTAGGNVSLLLHFDGSLTDSSGTSVTITAEGDADTSTDESKFGSGSLHLPDGGDHLVTGASAGFAFGTNDFTVDFWCWVPSGGTGGVTSYPAEGSDIAWGTWVYKDSGQWKLGFDISGSGNTWRNVTITDETWHHVAFSRQSGSVRFFLDGVQAGSGASIADDVGATGGEIMVGFPTGLGFAGYIDEFRVVKGASLFNANFTPAAAPYASGDAPGTTMLQRRGTAANLAGVTLGAGQIAYETDTGKIKVGNGSTVYTSLAYVGGSASDITSGTLSASLLPTSGVAAGTYTSVTVDTYGRVTAGSSPSIAYSSLTGLPTLGTAAAAATTDFAAASHAHGNITNAGAIGSTSGQIVVTTTSGVLTTAATIASSAVSGLGGAATLNVGTTTGTVAAGDHTHAQLHDRSHAITSSSDHTATAWRVFYSDASGVVTELALGSSGQALISQGASAAPTWGAAGSTSASDLSSGTLANARMTTRARAAMNLYLWSSFR